MRGDVLADDFSRIVLRAIVDDDNLEAEANLSGRTANRIEVSTMEVASL